MSKPQEAVTTYRSKNGALWGLMHCLWCTRWEMQRPKRSL